MNPDLIGWNATKDFKEYVLSGKIYRRYWTAHLNVVEEKWYDYTQYKQYIPKDANIKQVWEDEE